MRLPGPHFLLRMCCCGWPGILPAAAEPPRVDPAACRTAGVAERRERQARHACWRHPRCLLLAWRWPTAAAHRVCLCLLAALGGVHLQEDMES